jgi:predicted lactoylglutathione lyase
MLLTEDFFRGFITDEIADTGSATEVITAISAAGRDEVDELTDKALAAGGSEHRAPMEEGPMYARSFKDPDGHVWEVVHMDGAA